jgi:hypothetical protein
MSTIEERPVSIRPVSSRFRRPLGTPLARPLARPAPFPPRLGCLAAASRAPRLADALKPPALRAPWAPRPRLSVSQAAAAAWAEAPAMHGQVAAQRRATAEAGTQLRSLTERLRAVTAKLGDWPADTETRVFSADERGAMEAAELTQEEAQALQADLTERLEAIREAEGLQATLLQELNQAFERACTRLSELLRSAHEAMMALIANLR